MYSVGHSRRDPRLERITKSFRTTVTAMLKKRKDHLYDGSGA